MPDPTNDPDPRGKSEALDDANERAWARRGRHLGGAAGVLLATVVAVVGMSVFFPGADATDSDPPETEVPPELPVPAPFPDREARELFLQALEDYRVGPKPEVESEAFAAWSSEARARLEAGEKAAVEAFANSAFGEALRLLTETAERAERELASRDTAFREALDDAETARAASDHARASSRIAQALKWKPADPEAQVLARRIDELPAVAEALEEARVARVENRPRRELEALRKALAADPDRPDARARAEALFRDLAAKRYARALNRGLAAASAGDLDRARARLADARSLAPDREETLALEREVEALARRGEVRRAFERAEADALEDRWREAAAGYAAVLMQDPVHAPASGRLDRAREILATRAAVEGLLARPERLAEAGAERAVAALIERGLELSAHSPSLAGSLRELARQSERYRREISVLVISDGRTSVAVRGVGRIGEVENKSLRLRPGRYTFEGRRKGYRDKLVAVALTPEDDGREIEVSCDTPLETR